jgi:diguanylate cyclase (GGDEF)-like protein/PAS domain S-box-containing protein
MNKSGLVIRFAVVIIFTAVIVGLITTQLFYRYTFLNEKNLGEQSIKQLYHTVSPTASIASYLNDKDLTEEVVNGLISNDIITSAAIQTDTLLVESDNYNKSIDTLTFDLYAPFQKEIKVGVLSVNPNENYLVARANEIGATNALVIAIEALIITIISILVTYYVITQPILNIGKALHSINPGTSNRIGKPLSHKKSEIGQLTDDVNDLLTKAEQQMIKEKGLRSEVKILEARFRMLFENSTSSIALVEPQGDILLYNESFERLITRLNLPLKKNYGNYLQDLFVMKKELHAQIKIAFANNESAVSELALISDQDEQVWMQVVVTLLITDDFQENYQITLHDISKRKKQMSLLDQQANYDRLTNLLNRQAAEHHLKQLIMAEKPFALIMMDLNDFKPINDIFGHDAGDELLVHVSSQLLKGMRKIDVLSRWGGDEFVIILPNTSREDIIHVCAKLSSKLSKSYHLSQHGQSVSVTASMGVSFYPDDQVELLELIRSADKAMYQVKKEKAINNELYLAFTSGVINLKVDIK